MSSSKPIHREVEHFVELLRRHGTIGVLATLSEALERLDQRTSRVPFRYEDVISPYIKRKEQIDKLIRDIDSDQTKRRRQVFPRKPNRS